MSGRQPPRLLGKTLTVTFVTVALLLVAVFIVVMVSVRQQVRQAVVDNLESSQRLFAAVETRRQGELRAQAANLAESPTLKAALDTYIAEAKTIDDEGRRQLLSTIAIELDKVAARVEGVDALVLVDATATVLAAAGPSAGLWPAGRPVHLAAGASNDRYDGVAQMSGRAFRVVTVPLSINDAPIGALHLTTSLDQAYAESLAELSRTSIALLADGLLLATTLPPSKARAFEAAVASSGEVDGSIDLDGEAFAYRRLVQVGGASFYALGSIDQSSSQATRDAMRSLILIAVGATALALLGSVWLAHQLTEPIGRLSASLQAMAAARDVEGRLPRTGSSRELDTLTDTFNAMMQSVSDAEAQTEAAYTGAIRALAAALDARDPYTAGHSERVSVISVAIGRVLKLPEADLEVLRLGALLHDIGKIGLPDDVLRKPGPLTSDEYDIIKQHPVLGARILRPVPFLAPHIPIVELHHERPDGRGYPQGLRGDDIPLAARMVHAADAYDAMTSARAYRRAMPAADALRELWRCAGTEYHAEIVGALAAALPGGTFETYEAPLRAVRA